MKKRKLRAELQYACEAVGYEPGDVVGLAERISRRVEDLHEVREIASKWMKQEESARSAARLWKRAAKRYRLRFVAERAAWRHMREQLFAREAELTQAREDWEHVREERDAARAELASMRKDRDAVNEDCVTLKAERDAAIRAADSRHAKLVEVADKLRASRVDVDVLQQALGRMRPVVEEACGIVGRGYGLPESFSRAVEAYRAGGEHGKVVVSRQNSGR